MFLNLLWHGKAGELSCQWESAKRSPARQKVEKRRTGWGAEEAGIGPRLVDRTRGRLNCSTAVMESPPEGDRAGWSKEPPSGLEPAQLFARCHNLIRLHRRSPRR